MAEAISVSAPISGTDRTLSFETGKLAKLADGAVVGRIGDTVLLATATAARSVREGTDFFPLTVDIEERAYAAGQDPRLVLPPGGQGVRPGHLDLPAHRPPAAAVVPQGLPQRGPRRRHHLRGRPGQPPRRPGHQRRLGRPHAVGHPLRRPDRRRAHRLLDRGHLDPPPHLPGGRRVHLRAGRGRPGAARGRRRRDRHHDGRGRRHREVLGATTRRAPPRSPRRCWPRASRRPRPGSASRSSCSASWWPTVVAETRPDRAHRVQHLHATTATTSSRGWRPSAPSPLAKANAITDKAERNAAIDEATDGHHRASWPAEFPEREREIKAAVTVAHEEAGAQARIVEDGRPHRRPRHHRHPAAVGRGRPVPDRPRLGPVPAGRDPGAERDHPRHAADEPAARHHQPGRRQALHAPLQLPAVLDR